MIQTHVGPLIIIVLGVTAFPLTCRVVLAEFAEAPLLW